jgi:hypothetical protein
MTTGKQSGQDLELIREKNEHSLTLKFLTSLFLLIQDAVEATTGEPWICPDHGIMKDVRAHLEKYHGRPL